MEKGFSRIIKHVSKDSKVFDIGCGGLGGENTTSYLIERVGPKNITGLVRKNQDSERFANANPNIDIIFEDFFDYKTKNRFDVVSYDLGIESSLWGWSIEGLDYFASLLNKGGYFITYIMTTDQYGDPDETPKLIRDHWDKWWGPPRFKSASMGKLLHLKGWELLELTDEERRPYITWALLQKK